MDNGLQWMMTYHSINLRNLLAPIASRCSVARVIATSIVITKLSC